MCRGQTSLKTLKIWVPRNAKIYNMLIDKAKKKLKNLEINKYYFNYSHDESDSDDNYNGESEEENSYSDNDDVDNKDTNHDSENGELDNGEESFPKYPGNVKQPLLKKPCSITDF